MRADTVAKRIVEGRARLGLPTPCADCSDPTASTYCGRCVGIIAQYMGISFDAAMEMYGNKRNLVQDSGVSN